MPKKVFYTFGIVTRTDVECSVTSETCLLRGVGRVRKAMEEEIMSLGTSVAEMKQEEEEEEEEKEDEVEEEEEKEG